MAESKKNEKRAAERRLFETEVTLQTESETSKARSVDISDYGIRIRTEKPVAMRIRIKEDDRMVQYDAQLVWARLKEDGTMEYGLKY